MKLQLVKLGGNLIAPKNWPAHTADVKTIRRLAKEVKAFWEIIESKTDRGLIVGHGGGNFPHTESAEYKVYEGFSDERGKLGACLAQQSARDINSIVVKELLKLNLPVAVVVPHDVVISRFNKLKKGFFETIRILVKRRVIPVLYGDPVWDEGQGSIILSTERCLAYLAKTMVRQWRWKVERFVQAGLEQGVLDSKGKVIGKISKQNFNQLKYMITGAKGVDVTGGMLHKVEESLKLAKDVGIETVIISGRVRGRLTAALRGEPVLGTRIGN